MPNVTPSYVHNVCSPTGTVALYTSCVPSIPIPEQTYARTNSFSHGRCHTDFYSSLRCCNGIVINLLNFLFYGRLHAGGGSVTLDFGANLIRNDATIDYDGVECHADVLTQLGAG